MARVIEFFDGFTSTTTPTIGNIAASDLVNYPDDATYEATELGAPSEGNIYWNTTLERVRYYDGAAWQSVGREVDVLANAADIADIRTTTGTADGETDMGTYTGSTISDNGSTKANIQELETAVEANDADIAANVSDIADLRTTTGTADGDTDMGTFTGAIITDNVSTKTALQELETAVENIPSGLAFQGNWDAATNSPALVSSTGTAGHYYLVSVAGSTSLDGESDWGVGDWAVFTDTGVWQKIDNSDQFPTDTDDLSEGSTNLYYTDTRADARIAAASVDDLSDVDTTTVAPVAGNALVYDDISGNWVPGQGGGSGQGGINYVINTDFEDGSDDVTVSANVTKGLETTTPGRGDQSLKLTIGTSATTADFADILLEDVDNADLGKSVFISFDYRTDANYTEGDVQFVLRNVDSSSDTLIIGGSGSGNLAASSGWSRFIGRAVLDLTDNSYSLRMNVLSAPGTASNIDIDNVIVGPKPILDTPIITDEVVETGVVIGATTTAPGKGTTSTDRYIWSRSGSKMKCRIELSQTAAGGSAGSGDYLVSLPGSGQYSIDTNNATAYTTVEGRGGFNIKSKIGTAVISFNGLNHATGHVNVYGSNQVRVALIDQGSQDVTATGTVGYWGSGYFAFNAGQPLDIAIEFEVEIEEWQGASALVSDQEVINKISGFRGTKDDGQSIANTTDVKLTAIDLDYDIGSNWSTANNEFTVTEAGLYLISASQQLTGSFPAGSRVLLNVVVNGAQRASGITKWSATNTSHPTTSVADVLDLAVGDVVDFRIFHNAGGARTCSTDVRGNHFSVTKLPDLTVYGSYFEPLKTQTKFLTSDITTDTTVSDLQYANLEVGKWYRLECSMLAGSSTNSDNWGLTFSHDSSDLLLITATADGSYVSGQRLYGSVEFQATASTLVCTSASVNATSNIRGDGTRTETWSTLSEIKPKTVTNEW
mgnify:CR=1 FL=1